MSGEHPTTNARDYANKVISNHRRNGPIDTPITGSETRITELRLAHEVLALAARVEELREVLENVECFYPEAVTLIRELCEDADAVTGGEHPTTDARERAAMLQERVGFMVAAYNLGAAIVAFEDLDALAARVEALEAKRREEAWGGVYAESAVVSAAQTLVDNASIWSVRPSDLAALRAALAASGAEEDGDG